MSAEFTYRHATAQDTERLIALGLASYGQYAPLLTPEHQQRLKSNMSTIETWQKLLSTSKSFLCECGNELAGMAFLIPSGNAWDIFLDEWAYIRMLGVHPRYQGRGIARRLTELCISHAKAKCEKTLALHTSEMMPAARHIYESLGFKILREIEPRLGKRYWIYTLDLTEKYENI